jgi:hypothetical protein
MQSISPQMYPQLIAIINEAYSDCIESISSAELDGNNDIVCLAQSNRKQLKITIKDENDSIEVQDAGIVISAGVGG